MSFLLLFISVENMAPTTRSKFRSLKYDQQITYLNKIASNSEDDSDDDSDADAVSTRKSKNPVLYKNKKLNQKVVEYSDVEDVYNDNEIAVEWADSDSSDDGLITDESEEECDVDNDPNTSKTSKNNVWYGKDKTKWTSKPTISSSNKTAPPIATGPKLSTKNLSIIDTFNCIFNDEMRNVVITETNRKAKSVFDAENESHPDKPLKIWKLLTTDEFNAYLGVLITSGVHHSNKEHVTELFKEYSHPLYRASIGKNRFKEISRFLRFDDFHTREERLKTDKAAPISNLFGMLNHNLFKYFDASECVTVDEQLYSYRGRTRFTQYMPNKPAKYGIKVWWACDASTGYPLFGEIYTGQPSSGREVNQGERVVKSLVTKFKDTGRNIVTDNFFTTLPLAKCLSDWNLTLVGTIKKNKTCIPKEMLADKQREPLSTMFGFHENVTLCSYVPKKNKAVTLISTLHNTNTISDDDKKKPEIIKHYNRTKGGVDLMDKMAGAFSVQRKTLRWPVSFFYNIIDLAGLAAYIIYKNNNPIFGKRSDSRRTFLKILGKELAMPTIMNRSRTPTVYRKFTTRVAIEFMIGKPVEIPVPIKPSVETEVIRDSTGRLPVLGVCFKCVQLKNRRKTRKNCSECRRPICAEHSETITICPQCKASPNCG
ncbi:hypothetical protein HA402_012687 [Bradysia odoriphaga]|nr:hypothetical protein HA402_012687 [Bradysia odoriphaga]